MDFVLKDRENFIICFSGYCVLQKME